MNTALWICQIFLAITFFYSGVMKSTKSEKELIEMGQTGVKGYSQNFIRFIGFAELSGVAGITLPWLFQIVPLLTPVTALCFCIVMAFAGNAHIRLKEYKAVALNIFIFLAALFVVVFRLRCLITNRNCCFNLCFMHLLMQIEWKLFLMK